MITTDYRMWEFDEEFIDYILKHRILAIDMEIATLFAVGYALNVPIGAIMLISDLPLREGGIKGKDQARKIFKTYTEKHLDMGVKTFEELSANKLPTVTNVHPVNGDRFLKSILNNICFNLTPSK